MRFWLDSEFMEDGKTIELLSIGIVAEDGREYYAISRDADWLDANDWVAANVIPALEPASEEKFYRHRGEIAEEVEDFVGEKPEFWGYYADYDWVVLCQLYGRMIDLPKGWPMFCLDVKQLCWMLGNPKLPPPEGEHHALVDARWTKGAFDFLMETVAGKI
jgi:3' exoribonuclease, RNase T-like